RGGSRNWALRSSALHHHFHLSMEAVSGALAPSATMLYSTQFTTHVRARLLHCMPRNLLTGLQSDDHLSLWGTQQLRRQPCVHSALGEIAGPGDANVEEVLPPFAPSPPTQPCWREPQDATLSPLNRAGEYTPPSSHDAGSAA